MRHPGRAGIDLHLGQSLVPSRRGGRGTDAGRGKARAWGPGGTSEQGWPKWGQRCPRSVLLPDLENCVLRGYWAHQVLRDLSSPPASPWQ